MLAVIPLSRSREFESKLRPLFSSCFYSSSSSPSLALLVNCECEIQKASRAQALSFSRTAFLCVCELRNGAAAHTVSTANGNLKLRPIQLKSLTQDAGATFIVTLFPVPRKKSNQKPGIGVRVPLLLKSLGSTRVRFRSARIHTSLPYWTA